VQKIADRFNEKKKRGLVKSHGSGFGGRGFKFDAEEDEQHDAVKFRHKAQFKEPGEEEAGTGRKDDGAAAASFEVAEQRIGAVTAKYAATADPAPEAANMSEVRLRCSFDRDVQQTA
jgi:hypothetical protein